jgi:Pyruvate/2-oxoacid:ferredoxin oxidoreductase delta subunit
MKRQIIQIDDEKCNGCGECIIGCPEGAIQLVNGKAKLVNDTYCDGLGACIGDCPVGAITVIEREAEAYDEVSVIEEIVQKGDNVIKEHLTHLFSHNQDAYLNTAIDYLKKNKIDIPEYKEKIMHNQHHHQGGGCPGSQMMDFSKNKENIKTSDESGSRESELSQWPVQLHLLSPEASYFKNADVLIAADCVAFTVGDFHKDFLKGKRLAIACPKLDSGLDIYEQKISEMIDKSGINTITVMIMQVPCCRGLLALVKKASEQASRKVPVKCITISLQGEVLEEKWI